MVGLKKLLLAERHPLRPSTSPTYELEEPDIERRHFKKGLYSRKYKYPPLSKTGAGYRVSTQSMDLTSQFDQIEKHFEDLHNHFQTRPQSSQSSVPTTPKTPNGFGPLSRPKSRHIDLLEAVNFTSDRVPENDRPNSPALPVTCLYNEDIAERNMTRFLRVQYRSRFSRRLSSLYQEDVADRNIAQYGGESRAKSSLSCRSLPSIAGWVRDPNKRKSGKPSWASEENLRSNSPKKPSQSKLRSQLRLHKSVPALPTDEEEENGEEKKTVPEIESLGVPPAFKLGRRFSSTPLPDSPTLPDGKNESESIPHPRLAPSPRSSSLNASSIPLPVSRCSSRKNVRDLSINTQLAAQGPKIAHRAISPPTPSKTPVRECKGATPSIAEVMHTSLPEPTPSQPSPRFKVSEMMDLFNKAYFATQTQTVSSNPTYESLQDAIVREINSHEAFKRVPIPDQGPPFTPPCETTIFEASLSGVSRSPSSPISKLIKKSSFKLHRVSSETHQSVSIVVPPKGGLLRRASTSASRRRHTDAPAPSPALFPELRQSNGEKSSAVDDQLTYLDVLVRAGQDKFPAEGCATDAPYTHHMQAHSNQMNSSSYEMDDEILHLPSPGFTPRLQVEGVDAHVRDIVDYKGAGASRRNWSYSSSRSSSSTNTCDKSLSPISRSGSQLQSNLSVETY